MNRLLWGTVFFLAPICCCCGTLSTNVDDLVSLNDRVVREEQIDFVRVPPYLTATPTPVEIEDEPTAQPEDTAPDDVSTPGQEPAPPPTVVPTPTEPATATAIPTPTTATSSPTAIPTIVLPSMTPKPSLTPTSTPTVFDDDDDDDDDDGDDDEDDLPPSPTPTPTPPEVIFSAGSYFVKEGEGPALITVTLSGALPAPATVKYASRDRTATAGADYSPLSNTLTLPAGQTSLTFLTPITDDLLIEGPETAELILTDPSPSLRVGTLNTASLTIISNDQSVVNVADDIDDGACTVAHCSLREAIRTTNATPGRNAITFTIPGPTPHTISPITALPPLTDPVILDGTTQPGASCAGWPPTLLIEVSGAKTVSGTDGLRITADDSIVRGLAINNFASGAGLTLSRGSNNLVECNFIGLGLDGQTALANRRGVLIGQGASNNLIGGATAPARNLISGNLDQGVLLADAQTSGNQVQGNYIGPDVTRTIALGNGLSGIRQQDGATLNTIGGPMAETSNLIAGNKGGGISNESGVLTATHNTIISNTTPISGGGVFNSGWMTITHSAINSNTSTFSGGGIFNAGVLKLKNSTVSSNSNVSTGGGIANAGTGNLDLVNDTVSNNTANSGGGIFNAGILLMHQTTISSNTSGIFNESSGNSLMGGNLIGNSLAGLDCDNNGGNFGTEGYNLDSDTSCVAVLTGSGPDNSNPSLELGPLQDNGGSTKTHALLPSSPAVDRGKCFSLVDQRGVIRPVNRPPPDEIDGCDVGSFELQ